MKKILLTVTLLGLSSSVFASNTAQKGGNNQGLEEAEEVKVASTGQEAKRVTNDRMDAEMNEVAKTPSKQTTK